MKFLIMQSSPASLIVLNILLKARFPNTLNLSSSFSVRGSRGEPTEGGPPRSEVGWGVNKSLL